MDINPNKTGKKFQLLINKKYYNQIIDGILDGFESSEPPRRSDSITKQIKIQKYLDEKTN